MKLEKNYKVYKILRLKTLRIRINFKKAKKIARQDDEIPKIRNIEKNLTKPRSKSKKKKKIRRRRKGLEFYPG